jgi:HD-GYP domain-containing protein (c-di-GMP phosphodiesterase class II)
MNSSELELWRKHPERGAALLANLEGLPAEITQIVLHHHEAPDGSGFPAGLTTSRIHPVAKVISMADEFFRLHHGTPRMEPAQAIRRMEANNRKPGVTGVRWENLAALKIAFKV